METTYKITQCHNPEDLQQIYIYDKSGRLDTF
jgi:hypothetical protein